MLTLINKYEIIYLFGIAKDNGLDNIC